MRLNVKFKESRQSFNSKFGEVHNISDGGYERGYAEGETVGYNNGYTEGKEQGYTEGTKDAFITETQVNLTYRKFGYCTTSALVGKTIGECTASYNAGNYNICGYALPTNCKQIRVNAQLNSTFAMGRAKNCIVFVTGYTSEGGGTCVVAADDVVITPETCNGTAQSYLLVVPNDLDIDGVYLSVQNLIAPVLTVTVDYGGVNEVYDTGYTEGAMVGYANGYTEGKTEGIEQGYNEGYTKADNENPFYYIKSMAFAFSSRVFSAEKSNVLCRVLECTDWNMAFGQLSGIKTLKIICDTQGLNVVWQGLVRQSADIELLDLTEFKAYPTTIAYFAYMTPKLKTILGALDLSQCTTATAPFGGAKEIEDIEFVPNTIKISIEFSRDCTKLTKASLTSIINGLSAETSGLTVSLSKTAVNNAFTDEEWATLIATKSNWTISLS